MNRRTRFGIVFAVAGALLSRWHGGGFFHTDKVIINIIWGLCITIALAFMIPNDNIWTYSGWLVFCFAVSIATKATGHGQYFSLGTVWKKIEPERLDFIVAPLFGDDPRVLDLPYDKKYYPWLYWRCVFGMTIKGLLTSLGAAIPLLVYNPPLAVPIILGGLFMGVCYMIGRAFFPPTYATEPAEYLSGLFLFAGIAVSLCS
jgi:hypothetical protein